MERINDDDDNYETVMIDGQPRKILKDRRRVHIRMTDAAPYGIDFHDGAGRDIGHKPGFAVPTDQGLERKLRDAKTAAYDAYDRDQRTAWMSPSGPNPTAGSSAFAGAQAGDLCTCRGPEYPLDFGSPGHLQMRGDRLVCVPDEPRSASPPPSGTASDAAARIKQAAYDAYDRDQQTAWQIPS